MAATALAAALGAALWGSAATTPVHDADGVAPGRVMLHFAGGFTLVHVDPPSLPPVPVLTGDAEVAWGLAEGLDVRARYTTWFGLVHRLAAELRAGAAPAAGWALGVRVAPSVQLAASAADREAWGYSGEVATTAAALVTVRPYPVALTLEAGVTVQWAVFYRVPDEGAGTVVADAPFLNLVELAAELEWPLGAAANLSLRVELGVPVAPDDPWATLGVHPRVVLGGSFAP